MLLEVSERVANRAQTIELPHDGVHRPAPLFDQQTPKVLNVAGYGPAAAEKFTRGAWQRPRQSQRKPSVRAYRVVESAPFGRLAEEVRPT